jgi:predicted SnoaL-like aldol condensation-catalyzing enzyme
MIAKGNIMSKMNVFRRPLGIALAVAALLPVAAPVAAHNKPIEAANKKVVLDFYSALESADAAGTTKVRIQQIAEKYISPDYIQHAEAFAKLPGAGTARDKLVRMFQSMPAMKLPPSKTISVMAEGDLVMMLTARDLPDPASGQVKPAYAFNMFRVKNGRLTEHWDILPAAFAGGPPGMAPPPGMVPPGGATPPVNN